MVDKKDEHGARSFLNFVSELGDGLTNRGLSEDLRKMEISLNDLSLETGTVAKGELVLKLKFKTEPNGVCHVTPEVKLTLPKKPTYGGVMWHDPKTGHLTAKNPKQMELGNLREVPRIPGKRNDDEGTGN